MLLLWDAASAAMAERFLAEGALPSLARLAALGTRFAARPAWPCAQTPPGMATVLTGAPTHRHGIYGFREAARPRGQRNALETESGFDARRLRAEPLWTTAARAGRPAVVAFCPFASPADAYGPSGPWSSLAELRTLDGYGAVLAGQQVYRRSDLAPGEPPPPPPGLGELAEVRGFRVALPLQVGSPEPPRASPDPASEPARATPGAELWLGVGRRHGSSRFDAAWVAAAGSRHAVELPIGDGGAAARVPLAPFVGASLVLFELAPDASDLVLWRGGIWRLRGSGSPSALEAAFEATGPFLGAGAGHAYREGSLGPTCRDGGPGLAERRYLASLRASSGTFARASVHVLEQSDASSVFLYEPCIDETAHLVQDLAEDALAGDTGAAATTGLDVLRQAYRLADAHLGKVLDAAGEDAIVAVASDHGQEGVRRLFRPNVLLARAGLLAVDLAGRVDLSRTQVLYGFASNGYLVVNSDDRPHGIVPRALVERVARDAAARLLAWRDPEGRAPLERALFPGDADPRGRVPGDEAGDACIFAAPGVALGVGCSGEPLDAAHGGQHTTASDDPALDALFVVGGATVPAQGRVEARVDNTDVAPTLARLAGLPPPRDSVGRALLGP